MGIPVRLLIIEDSDDDTELMLLELRRHGYEPACARVDTADAMTAALDRETWDIVIADYSQRNFGPRAALALLKERKLDLPFLILSAGNRESVAVEAMKLGADDYVLKGGFTRLVPAVERELGTSVVRKARRRAEALKVAILEAALDAVITMNHNGEIVEYNPAAERMFGYKRSEAMGKTLADLIIPPALREKHRWAMSHYAAKGAESIVGKQLETTARRADGSEFPVSVVISCVKLEGPPLFTAFVRDITGRKESQKALVRLAAIVESTDDAIIGKDLDGTITSWNPGAERLYGYTAGEVKGRPISILVPPGHSTELARIMEDARNGKAISHHETVRLRKDGQSVPVSLTISPIRDDSGRIVGMSTIAHDITERKRAEDKLAQLASFSQQNPDPVFEIDLQGNLTYLNPKAEALFPDLREHGAVHPLLEGLSDVVAELQQASRQEHVRQVRSGNACYEEAISLSPDRKFVRIYALDITERVQIEEQALQLQKMHAIEQLAGGIAHHFNNIMGGVMGFSELLLKRLGPDDPLHKFAEQIKNGAERAASLTRQLLAFSRNVPHQPGPLDLNTVVAGLRETIESLVGDRIRLDLIASTQPWRVMADPGQMQQLLLHLAGNARDAMPNGGRLTIQAANLALDAESASLVEGLAPGNYVLLAVCDTGSGMTDETLEHAFEPFFTTRESRNAAGLGLAMCHGIVEQNGGRIRIETEAGKGTAIKVYLPATETAPIDSHPQPSTKQKAACRGTVLLVEDEAPLRELASSALQELGYDVMEAGDGEQALRLIQDRPRERIDILVTDGRLPKFTGKQLAENFLVLYPRSKVLFISGYPADRSAPVEPLDRRSTVLAKPFTLSDLKRKVDAIVGK